MTVVVRAHELSGQELSVPVRRLPVTSRLTLEASRAFATLFRTAMAERGFRSVYSLYLATDFSRATVERWLSARVRIPVSGAHSLVEVLADHSGGVTSLEALRELVAGDMRNITPEELLRSELRARRVPVRRALAALRAANLLPTAAPRES